MPPPSRTSSAASSKAAQRNSRASSSLPPRTSHPPQLSPTPTTYWHRSSAPLHTLAFLLPLLLLYNLGSILYLSHSATAISAENLFLNLFHSLGLAGVFLPSAAIITILLTWHILAKHPWSLHLPTLVGMLVESLLWTLPLLLLHTLSSSAATTAASLTTDLPVLTSTTTDLLARPWQERLTIAIGAGIYEETLFRFVGIALLHLILADILRIKHSLAAALAVLGSAIAFALYHDQVLSPLGINTHALLLYTLSGLYLGTLYLQRGLGIAVATHAAYNAIALKVLLP